MQSFRPLSMTGSLVYPRRWMLSGHGYRRARNSEASRGFLRRGAQVVLSRSDPSLTPARILKTGPTPLRAAPVEKAPSLFVKPSPTSILPSVVSAATLVAVEEGTDTTTPEIPVSMLTSASRGRTPLKSSS